MYLVGVAQKLSDDLNKSSDKYNRGSTKGEPDYIRDLPSWVMEDPNGGVGNKTNYGK